MPFAIPSFEEIRQSLIAAFVGRFPSKNVNKFSGIYKRLSVVALGIADAHYHIRQVSLDVMPDTAEAEQLDRHAAVWGVPRRGAVGAAKSAALRVFGTVGESVLAGEALTHTPSGLQFETRSGGTIAATGYLDVDIGATSTGESTNLELGEELAFNSTPSGLKDNARIVVELEGGIDQESDPDLRARLLNRIGEPAAGGNRNDFANWTLEAANFVAAAYVYPGRNGLGSVDIAALRSGSGSARLLTSLERAEVLAHIESVRPITATGRVLEVTAESTAVDIQIKPESDPAYAWDWGPTALTLSAYTSATRLVECTTARPTNMGVGDRVVFADPLLLGKPYVIESLSGTNDFVISEDPGAIAAGAIYPGSSLTTPIREAVQALFDALGPANPDGDPYGPWEGNLRHANLFETVQTIDGVLDSNIPTPAATVTAASDPAYPSNDTIGLLTAGQILVRPWL